MRIFKKFWSVCNESFRPIWELIQVIHSQEPHQKVLLTNAIEYLMKTKQKTIHDTDELLIRI